MRLRTLLATSVVALGIAVVNPAPEAAATTYSAPLATAIADLPVATENRAGYARDKFTHWIDADGDRCNTRKEVLIAEADDPVSVGGSCVLSGGRWFSYYDRVSWTDQGRIDIDHMVPLAEAWDSGASAWTSTQRRSFANDLGDYRSLVGVTDTVNQAKGDKDPREWLPQHDRCRYLRDFVAVKIRWRLTVDSGEKAAMKTLASGCSNVTITVRRAI
jgi:hypothetical protein